jgi:hypothetical protein
MPATASVRANPRDDDVGHADVFHGLHHEAGSGHEDPRIGDIHSMGNLLGSASS